MKTDDMTFNFCKDLWKDYHDQKTIQCILIKHKNLPELIEIHNTVEAWSSLIGANYIIYYLCDCLAVIVNEDMDSLLDTTAIIRLPREGKIIEATGTIIVAGYYEGEADGCLSTTGQPFLTSISPYAIGNMYKYIFDENLEVLL